MLPQPATKAAEIEKLLTPLLFEQQIEVVDVEYQRENGSRMLRVFIDTPHGVDVEDCSAATAVIRKVIDPIEEYDYDYMEVSSPGIDRIIKKDADFIRFAGKMVRIKTTEPYELQKKFTGKLLEYTGDHIVIEANQERIAVPSDIVLSVRLFPEL